MNIQKITPCLWVEKDAKAVAQYYLSIFKGGKLKDYRLYDKLSDGQDMPHGSFDTAVIEIAGVEFSILAAGPLFKFNEAISFVVNCKDQQEVDYYWEALTANGGEEGPSDNLEILQRRAKWRRALLATLLCAQGTPQLLAGDEMG
ncbi:MAG TPA: VOC family protein, partial [Chitinophagales bacterium]|nr:VOC family protein [Chitinophagales bacterium]